MKIGLPGSVLRILGFPLEAAGRALSVMRELAAVPAQIARLEEAIASASPPLPEEVQAALAEMPETVRQLEVAVAELVASIDEVLRAATRADGDSATAPAEPDLEPVQTAAERVGQLTSRLRVRRRRFPARAAG